MARLEAVSLEGSFPVAEQTPHPLDRRALLDVPALIAIQEGLEGLTIHSASLAKTGPPSWAVDPLEREPEAGRQIHALLGESQV